MLELISAALLKGLGFNFETHPELTGKVGRPDFAFSDASGAVSGVLEVTIVASSDRAAGAGKRGSELYDVIDNTRLPPGCFLSFRLRQTGKLTPSKKRVAEEVQHWVDGCAEQAVATGAWRREFEFDDWRIQLGFFRTESLTRFDRAINISHGGAEWASPESDIRAGLSKKADRYGIADQPFIIVLGNARTPVWGEDRTVECLSDALFGDLVVTISPSDCEGRTTRAGNGFWFGSDGARNQHVSAILFFPDVGLWGLRSELHRPLLAINPFATVPVPKPFFELRRVEFDEGQWMLKDGALVADLIGLPLQWPPPREKPSH
jgi:hypothetical protein